VARTLLKRALLAAPLLCAQPARAQDVVVRDAGAGQGADIVRRITAGPHVVRAGTTDLVLPRDSAVTTSLLVLGRPTYLASRVQGDVVVVGADLFLRPGADVSGRAVAIGGTVVPTSLGRVAGGMESLRDESYAVERADGRYLLDYRSLRVEDEPEPMFQLDGMMGVKIPRYDRVEGLSLPVGVLLQFNDHALELAPSATYRSRRGVVDPALEIRTRETAPTRLVARVARDTRSNDRWIYGDLINSLTTIWAGSDTRNYFRSDLVEARVIHRFGEEGLMSLAPYLGGRLEYVKPITAVGNVWSAFGRHSVEKMARPNPLVEPGHIGSALAGARFRSAGFATSAIDVDVEQSVRVPRGTSSFTQVTLDGEVMLPSFRTHFMQFHAHAVGTRGDAPLARFAYLGGSGTLRTLDLLEQGGTALFYLESRYLIPIDLIQLPVVGTPIITLRDAFGSAGVGSLPSFQHEVGVGIGMSVVRVEYTHSVAGKSGHEFGVGISLTRF
jgi:hypothetical protein